MLSIGEFARLGQVSPRMLRHYDQIGLLRPEHVNAATGYRSYGVRQLGRLQRIMALRDLGFGLEQMGPLLEDAPSVEQLRGMLLLRRAQIEEALADDRARLLRVEAYLRALETGQTAEPHVVIKKTQPLRALLAEATALALDPAHVGPVFMQILPEVHARLKRAKARPGIMIGYYDEPADDGSVVVHAGFEIGDQAVAGDDRVKVIELPVVEVASTMHHGSIENVGQTYEALLRWIEDSGYRIAAYARELYLDCNLQVSEKRVTELQVPIARRDAREEES